MSKKHVHKIDRKHSFKNDRNISVNENCVPMVKTNLCAIEFEK